MLDKPVNVLLVEDNLGDARLLYEGLTKGLPEQFQITHARRLGQALECLWEEPPNVVLLDLGLPDSHGLDTLRLVRAQAPEAPIVVLTGFQDETLALAAMSQGAQDYLVKGETDSKQLVRSIRYAVARKEAEAARAVQTVALTAALELQRSRQRLITSHESHREEIAGHLRERVQARLLALKQRLQEHRRKTNLPPETARFLNEMEEELEQVVQEVVAMLPLVEPGAPQVEESES